MSHRPKKSTESKHLSRLLRENAPEDRSVLPLGAKRDAQMTRGRAKRRKGSRE
jgi:hypothetical protein